MPFPSRSTSAADLGAPSDFGSAAAPASRPPADDDDTPGAGLVTPEAVHYHRGEQRCDQCSYFGQGGQCAVLNMKVAPEDGCNAFSADEGADDGSDDEDVAAGDPGAVSDYLGRGDSDGGAYGV